MIVFKEIRVAPPPSGKPAGAQARAAELSATSAVDAVTVYPDGASVTRIIAVDLPAGDNTLVAKDFPLYTAASHTS